MLYWLDTEFIEDGHTIDLLSIGIVAENGREFYAENKGADLSKANDWVKEHVLPQLHLPQCDGGYPATSCPAMFRPQMANQVRMFIAEGGSKPEFWGYCADYDWVVFCQLFGRMIDLPQGWPMYCRDIKQWCDDLGNPRLPEQVKGEHHALADARWNRQAWEFLREQRDSSTPG